jgi:hypothetical protein
MLKGASDGSGSGGLLHAASKSKPRSAFPCRPVLPLQGAFAEAQAQYLRPDVATVDRLAATLREKQIGVVAHFYMDPQVGRAHCRSSQTGVLPIRNVQEDMHSSAVPRTAAAAGCRIRSAVRGCAVATLQIEHKSTTRGHVLTPRPRVWKLQVQGVLSAAAEQWPHIHISDSLVMADAAVKMAEAGCRAVGVLGVDFMSENVRAILDEAGHTDVQVRRGKSAGRGSWGQTMKRRPPSARAAASQAVRPVVTARPVAGCLSRDTPGCGQGCRWQQGCQHQRSGAYCMAPPTLPVSPLPPGVPHVIIPHRLLPGRGGRVCGLRQVLVRGGRPLASWPLVRQQPLKGPSSGTGPFLAGRSVTSFASSFCSSCGCSAGAGRSDSGRIRG